MSIILVTLLGLLSLKVVEQNSATRPKLVPIPVKTDDSER